MRTVGAPAWETDHPERGAQYGPGPCRPPSQHQGCSPLDLPTAFGRPPCHSLSFQPMARPSVTITPPLEAEQGGRSAGSWS